MPAHTASQIVGLVMPTTPRLHDTGEAEGMACVLSTYSPWAFASPIWEGAYQATLAARVQATVALHSWLSLFFCAVVAWRVGQNPAIPRVSLGLVIIPTTTMVLLLLRGILWGFPSIYRLYWLPINLFMRILVTGFTVIGASYLPLTPPAGPPTILSMFKVFSHAPLVLSMFIIPGNYPLPLLPHIVAQFLLLASLVAGNRNLCENRLASPDLALHLTSGATYIQAASNMMFFVPHGVASWIPPSPLGCEALLGFVQVWGAVISTGLVLIQDVLSRRSFLMESPDFLGPMHASRAGTWPLGHPSGINACLMAFAWLLFGGILIWQYMLVLVLQP